MTTERIKEIQKTTGYPDSVSIQQALLQVWNEVEQKIDEAKPKWISVKDKEKPDVAGTYLVYGYWIGSKRKHIETADYSGEWCIVNNFDFTHWMPLPEAPVSK